MERTGAREGQLSWSKGSKQSHKLRSKGRRPFTGASGLGTPPSTRLCRDFCSPYSAEPYRFHATSLVWIFFHNSSSEPQHQAGKGTKKPTLSFVHGLMLGSISSFHKGLAEQDHVKGRSTITTCSHTLMEK